MNKTTNEILFDCQHAILKNHGKNFSDTYVKAFDFIDDFHINKGKEVNNNFSHDNLKGIVCFQERFNLSKFDVPVLGRHSWHPVNFCFFFYNKYRILGLPLLPIFLFGAIVDAIIMRKDQDGIPHTSGLLLDYFVLQSFGFKRTFKILTYLVERKFNSWDDVFNRYYPEGHRVLRAYNQRKMHEND